MEKHCWVFVIMKGGDVLKIKTKQGDYYEKLLIKENQMQRKYWDYKS